jgi:hypothetical protein
MNAFPYNLYELIAAAAEDERERKLLEILARTYVSRIREGCAAGRTYTTFYITEFEAEECKVMNALRHLDFQVVDYAVPAIYTVCRHGENSEVMDSYEKSITCVCVQW